MKPKPTIFDNVEYRSRLEARWAVFFKLIGKETIYEPQIFTTKHGLYTPDFYIAWNHTYAEVKPVWPTRLELDLIKEFLRQTVTQCHSVLLLIGQPDYKYYWQLVSKPQCAGGVDEKALYLERGGFIEDDFFSGRFSFEYSNAVEQANAMRFDGYDEDRRKIKDRYA